MDILNLGGINEPSERPSKKKLKVIIGIGLLAGVMGMGSTLAATITLNSGNVEFGQGQTATVGCDDQIDVTPTSNFVNTSSETGTFVVSTIVLDNVADGCSTKYFTVRLWTTNTAYAPSGTITNALYWDRVGVTGIAFKLDGSKATTDIKKSGAAYAGGLTIATTKASGSTSGSKYTITLSDGTPVLANAVNKITLESSDAIPSGYTYTG